MARDSYFVDLVLEGAMNKLSFLAVDVSYWKNLNVYSRILLAMMALVANYLKSRNSWKTIVFQIHHS